MRTYEKGDKVLFVEESLNGWLKKGDIGTVYMSDSLTSQIEEDDNAFNSHEMFILAETDSIERALEHIQKDMWIKWNYTSSDFINRTVITKVLGVRFFDCCTFITRIPDNEHKTCVGNETVEKIYFYDPRTKNNAPVTDSKNELVLEWLRLSIKEMQDLYKKIK